ncbi:MAG: hypothetical protein FJ125_12310 [Deltaproteobacteria bacterium]|nr:hypothetical protein [Deltaproteobacteria bacterium]
MSAPTAMPPIVLALLLVLVQLDLGCGPPPKPDSLIQLESMLRQPPLAELRTRQPDSVVEADKYRELAIRAWQDSEMDEAQAYTLISTMLYRRAAAESQMRATGEQARLDARRIDDARGQVQYHAEEIRQLEQRVAALTAELARTDQQTRDALLQEARRAEQQARPTSEEVAAVQQSLELARQALAASESVKANLYAAGRYNKARNLIGRAQQEIELGNLTTARQTIAEVGTVIEAAQLEATPRFQELEEKRRLAELAGQLLEAAQHIRGAEIRQEPRGVVIIVSDLFAPGARTESTEIKEERFFAIDQIGKMMLDFPSVPVLLEGHTDTSSPKPNREAQSRAAATAVRDLLVEKGLDSNRFSLTGYGDTMPVEDNRTAKGKAQNRRVEVVFKLR